MTSREGGICRYLTQGSCRRQHPGHLFRYSCLTMSFLRVKTEEKETLLKLFQENSQAFYLLV